jgi:hypothetical protein
MKIIIASFFITIFLQGGLFALECPKKPEIGAIAVENDLDCPWAGVGRLLLEKAEKKESLDSVFLAYAPGIIEQLNKDKSNASSFNIWGESINFDEMMHATIVHTDILSYLASKLDIAEPNGKIIHAGMEHTYGYLFSVLETKYGFKRARWVKPDIEKGLGLEKGILGPKPKKGSLFSNVTCFAGNISLRNDLSAQDLLQKISCPASLKEYASGKVKRLRLAETVTLPGHRNIILRTDFIPFSKVSPKGNAYVLIYSIYDSKEDKAKLITLFPVGKSFVDRVTAINSLGTDKPIKTRYNAWVEGFSGKTIKGFREIFWLDN